MAVVKFHPINGVHFLSMKSGNQKFTLLLDAEANTKEGTKYRKLSSREIIDNGQNVPLKKFVDAIESLKDDRFECLHCKEGFNKISVTSLLRQKFKSQIYTGRSRRRAMRRIWCTRRAEKEAEEMDSNSEEENVGKKNNKSVVLSDSEDNEEVVKIRRSARLRNRNENSAVANKTDRRKTTAENCSKVDKNDDGESEVDKEEGKSERNASTRKTCFCSSCNNKGSFELSWSPDYQQMSRNERLFLSEEKSSIDESWTSDLPKANPPLCSLECFRLLVGSKMNQGTSFYLND